MSDFLLWDILDEKDEVKLIEGRLMNCKDTDGLT